MTTSEALALGGGSLQIAGFMAVIMATTADLAKEYKEFGFFMRLVLHIRDFWLYWFGTLPRPVQLSASAHASAGARASVTARKMSENEVERLRRELGELKTEFDHFKEDTTARFATVEESAQSLREHLTTRTDELQQRLDAIRRGTLKKERRGAWAFVLGTALVVAAALV